MSTRVEELAEAIHRARSHTDEWQGIARAPHAVSWDRILAKPIQPRTINTVTDAEALRERWRAIRREGVAFDWSEWNADAPAVAVPLLDRHGHLHGALTIVVPIERASEEAMRRHAEVLRTAAAEISERLG